MHPRSVPLLIVIALIMLGFGVLDLREVSHQSDEGKSGLAALAAVVAALHVAAALLAVLMARAGRRAVSDRKSVV